MDLGVFATDVKVMVPSAMPERQSVDSRKPFLISNRIHVCKFALTDWLIIVSDERQGEDEMLHGSSLTTR